MIVQCTLYDFLWPSTVSLVSVISLVVQGALSGVYGEVLLGTDMLGGPVFGPSGGSGGLNMAYSEPQPSIFWHWCQQDQVGQFLDVQVACLDASNGTVGWAGEQVLRSQCGMGSASGGMIPWILSSECWCWQWLWCRVTAQPQTQLSGSLTLFGRAAQNGEGNTAFVHKPQHKGHATSRGTITTHRPRQAALCFAPPNIQWQQQQLCLHWCLEWEKGSHSTCEPRHRSCSTSRRWGGLTPTRLSTEFVPLLVVGSLFTAVCRELWALESWCFSFLCPTGFPFGTVHYYFPGEYSIELEYQKPHSIFGSSQHCATLALWVETGGVSVEAPGMWRYGGYGSQHMMKSHDSWALAVVPNSSCLGTRGREMGQ